MLAHKTAIAKSLMRARGELLRVIAIVNNGLATPGDVLAELEHVRAEIWHAEALLGTRGAIARDAAARDRFVAERDERAYAADDHDDHTPDDDAGNT
jgi:hypothetical protein